MRVATAAVARLMNADHCDYAGASLLCPCRGQARYAGRREKTFHSVLGPLVLLRAYYHCGSCGTGFFPRDEALGLAGGSLSPGVLRMVARVGAMVSFQEGHELLMELAGVQVPTKHVERAAEALGREVAQDERSIVEPPSAAQSVAPTLYLGMDGTGVPMRKEELVGRSGKGPEGSPKTREAKLCALWSEEARDEEGLPVRDQGSISYSAAIESAAQKDTDRFTGEFAERVLRESTRRGFERATRQVILGDGAKWIWNLADEHFPAAIQIVDRYHAKEHLSQVAGSLYGPGSDLSKHWARERHQELDAGDINAVLRSLRLHSSANNEARKAVDYFKANRSRMRYAAFRAAGLCTSTGVLEAGCKTVVASRCKHAGMHWTVAGAIIALRCCLLSGRFEDFWARRAHAYGSARASPLPAAG